MRPFVATLAAACFLIAGPAAEAVEHVLVRWKKTGRCEIVTVLPLWGDHWIRLGAYGSRGEAERALALGRRAKACPTGRSARRMDKVPETARTAPTYRPIDR
jgi:hypothetical protein